MRVYFQRWAYLYLKLVTEGNKIQTYKEFKQHYFNQKFQALTRANVAKRAIAQSNGKMAAAGIIEDANLTNIQKTLKKINESIIKEQQKVEKEINEFETELVDIFIVLRENGGIIYNEKEEVISSWTNNLGYVPVIPVYSAKTGFLSADIPLLDLADMNIEYFNKYLKYKKKYLNLLN